MFNELSKRLGQMGDKVSHYDIYTYEGWTLREVQDPMTDMEYDQEAMRWKRKEGELKTTIVWGVHTPCGLSGCITVTTGKVYCQKCKTTMPQEVYQNLIDAMEMMKGTLDGTPGSIP